ncbi:hypothetical protein F8388_008063 [Cannabis sativa]|uniref:Uncharacterized protein n=2 Tax=Cannabis sativa TaxID=3483 RepID=A0A7J6DXS4_CANSA|nr:hypothetical protein F8388_008063 [Cannabis sativa]
MDSDPPLYKAYKTLFDKTINELAFQNSNNNNNNKKNQLLSPSSPPSAVVVDECELPLIDLSRLSLGEAAEREECKSHIARASREWGFFQVINHGISKGLLEEVRSEQEKVFKEPFEKKSQEDKYLKFSAGSYRWGTPTATCLGQLSWSEAFHIPLHSISSPNDNANHHNNTDHFRSTVEQFAKTVSNLALKLAVILAEKAWSNDVYKSVEHRVVTNAHVERFSTAYFLCPSYDTVLDSGLEPSVYTKFSFREYRRQVQDDVTNLGFKIGLRRFLNATS